MEKFTGTINGKTYDNAEEFNKDLDELRKQNCTSYSVSSSYQYFTDSTDYEKNLKEPENAFEKMLTNCCGKCKCQEQSPYSKAVSEAIEGFSNGSDIRVANAIERISEYVRDASVEMRSHVEKCGDTAEEYDKTIDAITEVSVNTLNAVYAILDSISEQEKVKVIEELYPRLLNVSKNVESALEDEYVETLTNLESANHAVNEFCERISDLEEKKKEIERELDNCRKEVETNKGLSAKLDSKACLIEEIEEFFESLTELE